MAIGRYRHIIWDWNGTLLDDLDLSIGVMNDLLLGRNLPVLDRVRYHALFDFPVRTYYERLGFDPGADPFEKLSVEFIRGYDERRWSSAVHPGAVELLQAIRDAGVTQSILSAYRHATLCEIVNHFGLSGYFTRLCGLDNIYAQSKIELGRAWLHELALPRQDLLLIGDTLHDCEVAAALEIDCVLVAHGHHPLERLQQAGPRVVKNCAELGAWLGLPALTPTVLDGPDSPAK